MRQDKQQSQNSSTPGNASLEQKNLGREHLDHVSGIFKAMSDTTRLLILRTLKDSHCSVGELVAKLDTTQANISKHLKILHSAQLLNRTRSGNQIIYSIKDPMVLEMCQIVCDKLNRETSDNSGLHFQL